LKKKRKIEIETNCGKFDIVIDPNLAPQTATQIDRLFEKGAYTGTRVANIDVGFAMQIGAVDDKAPTFRLSEDLFKLIRRLPVEARSQYEGETWVHKFVLCMSKADAPDSATSSFLIMLGDRPDLNYKQTVFGYLMNNDRSIETLDKIGDLWRRKEKAYIIKTRAEDL
jgi:cyclophilin family peptidyl-prolyl cis-trans isomerase